MALHGDIAVNGTGIGTHWSAVRIEGGPESDGPCRYQCQVRHGGRLVRFEVVHDYRDGALILASIVLVRAVLEMKL